MSSQKSMPRTAQLAAVQEEPDVGKGRWTGPGNVNMDAGREEKRFLKLVLRQLLVRIPILIHSVVTHREGRARVRSSWRLWLFLELHPLPTNQMGKGQVAESLDLGSEPEARALSLQHVAELWVPDLGRGLVGRGLGGGVVVAVEHKENGLCN